MARNKYPDQTVEKILDVAFGLFCSKGYDNTSISDIVAGLDGLTKGAIYHHFDSKEAILDAAFERAMAPIAQARRAVCEGRGYNGAQKLRDIVSPESVVPQVELWRRMGLLNDPIANARILATEYRDSLSVSARSFLQPLIEEGIADGSIVCPHPREAAEALSLLVNLWLIPLFDQEAMRNDMLARGNVLVDMASALGIDLGRNNVRATIEAVADILHRE